jgi:putative ABC transport system ATP-binding protein
MIKISQLEKIYRTEDVETVALNKLSFEVKDGEFVAVMGPSGCGKSTLLNIVGLLDDPDEGSFLFNGIEVAKFNERKRADLRKRNIGFVFQSFNLIDELSVFENVELPLIYLGIKGPERKKRVEDHASSQSLSPTVIWRTATKGCRCPCSGKQAETYSCR